MNRETQSNFEGGVAKLANARLHTDGEFRESGGTVQSAEKPRGGSNPSSAEIVAAPVDSSRIPLGPLTGYLLPSNREIELRCPTCGLTTMTPVQPYDPPGAARMEDWCPECVSGGYGHPVYFDVDGREIDELDAADNDGDMRSQEAK